MGNENHFVYNPSTVDIRRSKFIMNSFWKGAIYHGDLVPVEITKVMPGDSAKYNLSCFIRTATPPIAPFMDVVHLSFAAFYVPERLVWSKEKEFLGETTEGYGIATEIKRPRSTKTAMSVWKGVAVGTYPRSLATYLGLVRQKETISSGKGSPISLNPLRAYLQVYNDWFRSENFQNPYLWNHSETGDDDRFLCSRGGSYYAALMDVPKVLKQLDRYTSCLPWAQKGSPVLLPLGDSAPIMAELSGGSTFTTDAEYVVGLKGIGTNKDKLYRVYHSDSSGEFGPSTGVNASIYADLGSATAASVNELRLAFATQRYLEALARSGSKYREYIKGIFGVNIGDTTAQMAEYLGGMTVELNIDQVLQTTDYAAGSSTKLGAPGAVSTSAASQYLFTKSFTEPGYLVIVAYTKHNRSYGQGIEELYQDSELLEDYNPKFANIGEVAIKKSNIYFTGDVDDDDTRLGFQEAWSQYKHKKDIVIGALCPSNTNSLNFWSLAENFASAPTLGADFITEDRTNITRVLSGGESSPDYFLDIKFKREFVRPMPLYDIPGLIDHH